MRLTSKSLIRLPAAVMLVFVLAGPLIGTLFAAARTGLFPMLGAEDGGSMMKTYAMVFQAGYLIGVIPALAAGAVVAAVGSLFGSLAAAFASAPAGAAVTFAVTRAWAGVSAAGDSAARTFDAHADGVGLFVSAGAVASLGCVAVLALLEATRRLGRAT